MSAKHASEFDLLRFDENFEGEIRSDEPLCRHTSYRIGGPASFWIEVYSINALGIILRAIKEEHLDWMVFGKGTNILVSDNGYPGAIVNLSGEFRKWSFDENSHRVIVGAGTILSRIVQEVFHRGYSGLEFAVGTPGTVGGAVRMNAGTAKDWIGNRIVSVTTLSFDKGLVRYQANDIEWGYRTSSFKDNEVIVECELQLQPDVSGTIHEKMHRLLDNRKKSQPLDYPSCGSVFRNPTGKSAGALIESAGLKGVMHGGAQISNKHANFIINKTGSATANDVYSLMCLAKQKVKELYDITLIPEVKFVGFKDFTLFT